MPDTPLPETVVDEGAPVKWKLSEARADLKDLLGREPTKDELNDFINDLKEVNGELEIDEEEFRKPELNSPELDSPYADPADRTRPYTGLDALKNFQRLGYMTPTDQ